MFTIYRLGAGSKLQTVFTVCIVLFSEQFKNLRPYNPLFSHTETFFWAQTRGGNSYHEP